MTDRPDPYAVLKETVQDLERQGCDVDQIIDACFIEATHGAIVVVGRKEASAALHDMARRLAEPERAEQPADIRHVMH